MPNIYDLKPALPVTQAMIDAGIRQYAMPPEMMRSILENALCHVSAHQPVPLYRELDRGIPD